MKTRESLVVGLLATALACSATSRPDAYQPDPNPSPKPGEIPAAGQPPPINDVSPSTDVHDEQIVVDMSNWLERFRQQQLLFATEELRYAEDVTVGGKVKPLPKSYETEYLVHQIGRNYSITVRHPSTNQRCYLQDGEFLPGQSVDNAGRIICGRY
jgi:hypothetical protein